MNSDQHQENSKPQEIEAQKTQAILEDWEDLMALRAAKKAEDEEPVISLDEVRKLLLS